MMLLKGWRYVAVIGGLTGLVFATIYPTIIDPYFHPEKWQRIQKIGRAGMNREEIQPGVAWREEALSMDNVIKRLFLSKSVGSKHFKIS